MSSPCGTSTETSTNRAAVVLDPKILTSLTRRIEPADYLRVTPWSLRSPPLGMGFGETRFASPTKAFRILYIAEDLATCLAEAIIRDRFEGKTFRELAQSDIADWGVCAVSATRPLRLLTLRGDACFKLGISTDIVGAKRHDERVPLARRCMKRPISMGSSITPGCAGTIALFHCASPSPVGLGASE